MHIALAAAVLLLAQAAPSDKPTPVASTPASAPAKPEKPKLICTSEVPTGTKFSQRVCRTPEEVKALEDSARDRSDGMRACRTGMGC